MRKCVKNSEITLPGLAEKLEIEVVVLLKNSGISYSLGISDNLGISNKVKHVASLSAPEEDKI